MTMTDDAGATRIWSCGLAKKEWTTRWDNGATWLAACLCVVVIVLVRLLISAFMGGGHKGMESTEASELLFLLLAHIQPLHSTQTQAHHTQPNPPFLLTLHHDTGNHSQARVRPLLGSRLLKAALSNSKAPDRPPASPFLPSSHHASSTLLLPAHTALS